MSGPPRSGTGAVSCPVIVGRDLELAALEAAWRSAGQILVIRGAAGIGKSRLVREFASQVRESGAIVLTGRCSPGSVDVPLRPLREALLAADRSGLRPSGDLGPFLPALGGLVPDWAASAAPGADRMAMVLAEGLLRLMAEWSTTSQVATVLVVEDLHWSDVETLKVVEYLADNLAGQPVLVVATVRDDEAGPGASLVHVLEARRAVATLGVHALDASKSEAMVRECLGTEAAPSHLLAAVVARSDGIPFFIEELLASALSDPTGGAVPTSIGAALEARVASLPDDAAQLIRYAAVLGRQFDWHVVAGALRFPPETAIVALRQATGAQLIDAAGGVYRFRHALTVDAVQGALLPEERRVISAKLSEALEMLHPELSGWLCQAAANLAEGAGEEEHAAELWLEAARRALVEGSLASAEALATRASDRRPVGADRALLSIWALAGQPLKALEAGQRILASGVDPSLATEVRFDLVDAMIDSGRFDDAENYLKGLRSEPDSTPSHAARQAIGESEVALARNERTAAMAFARSALADAQAGGLTEVACRALWLIGRVERGRNLEAASAAFEEAYDYATRHNLAVYRTRALLELGIIDMFERLATGRLEEARQEALRVGALSTAAMIDLHLAGTFSARGETTLTLEAAARCEEVSRRFALSSLPMSLALQAVAHGISGNRTGMDDAIAALHRSKGDRATAQMIALANGVALCHVGDGPLGEAIDAMDGAMELFRAAGGSANDFPGRWALLRTIVDDDGKEARDECHALEFDTSISRAALRAADAVAAGRQEGDAMSIFTAADERLGRFEGAFPRSLVRLLVAPCAYRDGWGDPAAWLRESLANFENLGLANFADQCRLALRAIGETVPRRARSDQVPVPGSLAAQGITAREVEVMAQVVAGRSNRDIAAALHLSVRTVEKHVERLLMKTGATRSELVRLAETSGIRPAD
jgi:DNA-binding CsgD family transcriptional regulator/tetratricopeptide (TPR) repeat protein